jgi:hypothetical protein
MKSVRVATLEVSEGEECGVPFFTLHKTQGGVLHTLFTVAIGASSYPGLGTERPRCPLSAHGSRPRCPVRFANRSRIIRTKSASGHSAAV